MGVNAVWFPALSIIANLQPMAYWRLTYGAEFWWVPDRSEILPKGFATQPFTYSEIASITMFDRVQAGKEILAHDWPLLRERLLAVEGLQVRELQNVQRPPATSPNRALCLTAAGGLGR